MVMFSRAREGKPPAGSPKDEALFGVRAAGGPKKAKRVLPFHHLG